MTDTALLVMDVQHRIVDRIDDPDYLPRLARAVAAARAAGIPVLHVVVGLRPGHPEIDPRNRALGGLPPTAFTEADPGAAVHPDVAPQAGETVIVKKRISAFAGSDLDMVLRSRGLHHLVLAGIATGGVVLSTFCQAADLDHRLTVLSDGCADPDAELHRALVERSFPRQSEVVTVDQWIKSIQGPVVKDNRASREGRAVGSAVQAFRPVCGPE